MIQMSVDLNEIPKVWQTQQQKTMITAIGTVTRPSVWKNYQKIVLFLGGSETKHEYLAKEFLKHCKTEQTIESFLEQPTTDTALCFKSLSTSQCHDYGVKVISSFLLSRGYQVVVACPLMDNLIPFTDQMNRLWNLPGNDVRTSQFRRNKYLMHHAIQQGKCDPSFDNTSHEWMSEDDNNDDDNDYEDDEDDEDNDNNNDDDDDNDNDDNDDDGNDGDNDDNDDERDTKNWEKADEKKEETSTLSVPTLKKIRYGKHFEIFQVPLDAEEFDELLSSNDMAYPVVVKPPASAGTEGVRLVHNFEALCTVLDQYLLQTNFEHDVNESLLIMEYLQGFEYVVNCVSVNGVHKCTDMWYANTFDANAIMDNDIPHCFRYDYQQFITAPNSDWNNYQCRRVIEYTFDVITLLGVSYGCSHVELTYLPSEDTVCLIELNARMHGDLPRSTSLVGYDQLSVLALSYMLPAKFLSDIPTIYHDIGTEANRRSFAFDHDTEIVNTSLPNIFVLDYFFFFSFVKKYMYIWVYLCDWGVVKKNNQIQLSSLNRCLFKLQKKKKNLLNNNDNDNSNTLNLESSSKTASNFGPVPLNPYCNKTVRAIFLCAERDGYFNFDTLHKISKLETFKRFARSLRYVLEQYLELDHLTQYVLTERKKKFQSEKESQRKTFNASGEEYLYLEDNHQDEKIMQTLTFEHVYNDCLQRLKESYQINKTIDLLTSPGCIVLQGVVDAVVQDTHTIRKLESNDNENGLYEYF
ncbi:hypothetical protein RFI_04517 [Reticulomyxa filosa]|uniref:ATP-grasp domain-containing protein n=1 Tax=Reticulomyxa filosa TaxID=46433 RepID=X6P226_RETFI|nr:hypothetical protein RFI_04517 [Reticulomyxa filosa]|eukprot:ETO32600.1 hypothetical protein RFI_04517 [Reticulomyxa filosa]